MEIDNELSADQLTSQAQHTYAELLILLHTKCVPGGTDFRAFLVGLGLFFRTLLLGLTASQSTVIENIITNLMENFAERSSLSDSKSINDILSVIAETDPELSNKIADSIRPLGLDLDKPPDEAMDELFDATKADKSSVAYKHKKFDSNLH